MAENPETSRCNTSNANECSIKVGTTGTISSLMTRELETMKHVQEASSSRVKKCQTSPVSIPCGASPRSLHSRRNTINERGNDRNSNNHVHKVPLDVQNSSQASLRNGNRNPKPSTDNNANIGRNETKDKPQRKGSSYIVEVVDLKCNNPMTGRLRKLGFSKLSDSVI